MVCKLDPPLGNHAGTRRGAQLDGLLCELEKRENPPRPLNFHDRNGLFLSREKSLVQKKLDELKLYIDRNQMEINPLKSMPQLFCFSSRYDFTPELRFGDQVLDVVYETELLGVTVSST